LAARRKDKANTANACAMARCQLAGHFRTNPIGGACDDEYFLIRSRSRTQVQVGRHQAISLRDKKDLKTRPNLIGHLD
jgi:hypothetical protein